MNRHDDLIARLYPSHNSTPDSVSALSEKRDRPFQPDVLSFLDHLLDACSRLHGFEENALVGAQADNILVQQAMGVTDLSIQLLGNGADVHDAPVTADDHRTVVLAQATEILCPLELTSHDQVAETVDRAPIDNALPPLPLALDQSNFDRHRSDHLGTNADRINV